MATRFIFIVCLLMPNAWVKAQRMDHPRLMVNTSDLPTLRSWATSSNPFYQQGIKSLAQTVMGQVQSGIIPAQDNGGSGYSYHFTEGYAHLLAFMALVEPDQTLANSYRTTAINLLMYIIDIADQGVLTSGTTEQLRFRRLSFSTSDRSRWIGQAFPLAVDWLYNYLSVDQKRKIRRVFIRWAEENLQGYPNHNYYRIGPDLTISPSNYNSPVWLDLEFDPVKKRAVRYAMNNYFNAHIRNIVMMAAAFDAADDVADPLVPGDYNGRLHEYREKFLHTWHYMADYAYRNENNGGVSAEGGEYMPALGFTLQLLLSLHTADYKPTVWGEKINIDSNPHWQRTVPALLNSLPPKRTFLANRGGWNYQPSWFGDGEFYHCPDVTDIFGPLGVFARLTNKTQLLESIKWIMAYTPSGSIESIIDRIDNKEEMTNSLFYFMTFDPASAIQAAGGSYNQPQEDYPTFHFANGAGRISNRTSWGLDASWVNYRLGFVVIDHQHGDGNMFDFYRKGEWLTKERTGYGNIMGSSDYKNTLSIKSNTDNILTSGFYGIHALRGSQFRVRNDGDPSIKTYSHNNTYFSVTGDATNLYNYTPDYGSPIKNVLHASRSLFWIKPDYIVVYDRVETNYNGFKQFWLNLPSATPQVSGRTISASTPGGQQLIVSNLLPAASEITLVSEDPTLYTGAGIGTPEPYPAQYDPMGVVQQTNVPNPNGGNPLTLWHPMRLRVQATGNPLSTRFLNVLQGRDANQAPVATTLIATQENTFEGAIVDQTAILFKRSLTENVSSFTIEIPDNIEKVFAQNLEILTSYVVNITVIPNSRLRVTVSAGAGGYVTDAGGVLSFSPTVAPTSIVGIQSPASISVPLGTPFSNLPLPTSIAATFSNNETGNVDVIFQEGAYNANLEGSYILNGTIVTSGNIINPSNLQVQITVIVQPALNAPPSDIVLSKNTINELQPIGTLIGTLSTQDADVDDLHTYTLVNGNGDEGNTMISIDENRLVTNEVVNVDVNSQRSVRIQSEDRAGAIVVRNFNLMLLAEHIFIPNTFSPNKDGVNDMFRVRGQSIQNISFKVVDTFGNVVFQATTLESASNTGWDGTFEGKELPAGVYAWILEGEFSSGNALQYKGKKSGNITLIR
jgi:gliding motility-associated-like protein